VRPFNTYGPRQSARAVIPSIITQLLAGHKEIKLGACHPTRDLLFVDDTVSGFVEIAKSDKTIGEEINISTQKEITIGELAAKIIAMINSKAVIVTDNERKRPAQSEVERLCGSNAKIRHLTSWEQKYDLDKGLELTIEWFRNNDNLKQYKTHIYNV
jgi:nucleoside-diphosphate-sugar epimerase